MRRSVNHISTIVKYITSRGILPFDETALFNVLYETMELADAFTLNKTKAEIKAEREAIIGVVATYNKNVRIKEPIEIIKLIDSLMYACGTWPPFIRSQAYFVLNYAREKTVQDIPQYQTAEWAIE